MADALPNHGKEPPGVLCARHKPVYSQINHLTPALLGTNIFVPTAISVVRTRGGGERGEQEDAEVRKRETEGGEDQGGVPGMEGGQQ